MSDIVTVKRKLADQAQAVAEHLLPGGRREGREWRAGSVSGEAGQSLGVHLSGEKAGVWSDFASGESGDLLDLWRLSRGLTLPQALDEARGWLGIERPTFQHPAPKSYTRPPKPRAVKPVGKARGYLCERRGIPAEVLALYRIGEDGDDIVFPFLLPGGELALAKVRKAEDGARPKPTAVNCEPVLFGWQAVSDDAREIVVTEGEIDALSMAAYRLSEPGIPPAVSVPFGGGGGAKQQWIEADYERLERFETIYLALDMDEPGEAAVAEIVSRLGRHRCRRIRLPHKDANECWLKALPPDEMLALVRSADGFDPDGLRRPTDYANEVVDLFWPKDGVEAGYRAAYSKLNGKLLFRPAEVTVWTGPTGSGKSQVISDCAVSWVDQGAMACIASFEMKPKQTLKRMVKQTLGADRPPEDIIRASLGWLSKGLLIYELVGKSKLDPLLEVFDYARAKYGCDTFVIDSLMRLGIATDDYPGQENAMYRIVDWAVANSVHVHVVAHARKGDGKSSGPKETDDVKGAGGITDNAFNVISIWRNRRLEDEIQAAQIEHDKNGDAASLQALKELRDKPGVRLSVLKQRNGDWEGKVGLWFDQASYQYRSGHDGGTTRRCYLPNDWRATA